MPAAWPERLPVLGVRVSATTYDEVVACVLAAARAGHPAGVAALAVHGVMTGALDPVHRRRLNELEILTPDGQPVRWALGWLHGRRLPDRVYGPNLTLRLCAEAAREGLPVYFYGSSPATVEALASNLAGRFPGLRVAGAEPSAFRRLTEEEQEALAGRIRASGARLVFVGLGCPRQEIFVWEMRGRVGGPMLAVGAAFDFHAGTVPQAPAWMQSRGLEWLFRLGRQPARLWRRYLLLNPLYLLLVLCQRLGLRRLDPDAARAEPPPERLG